MAWSPSYNSFALTPANGINIPDFSDHGPTATSMQKKVAGGGVAQNASLEGRRIRLDLQIAAATAGALETLIDDLLEELHREDSAILQLNSSRVIDAWCKPGPVKPKKDSGGLRADMKVEFITEDSRWRSASAATSTLLNSTGSPLTATINYTGVGATKIALEVENIGVTDYPGQTFTIKNLTTGKEIRIFKLDLGGGDSYHLDTDGQSYFESPVSADSGAPVRIDSVLFDLENGNNDIEITHNFGASSDINFKLAYFGRWSHCGAYA